MFHLLSIALTYTLPDLPHHLSENCFDRLYDLPASAFVDPETATGSASQQRLFSVPDPLSLSTMPSRSDYVDLIRKARGPPINLNTRSTSKLPSKRGVTLPRYGNEQTSILNTILNIRIPWLRKTRSHNDVQIAYGMDGQSQAHVVSGFIYFSSILIVIVKMSWSACLDSQQGIDSDEGGILTMVS